jgi:hypothetical protein
MTKCCKLFKAHSGAVAFTATSKQRIFLKPASDVLIVLIKWEN